MGYPYPHFGSTLRFAFWRTGEMVLRPSRPAPKTLCADNQGDLGVWLRELYTLSPGPLPGDPVLRVLPSK